MSAFSTHTTHTGSSSDATPDCPAPARKNHKRPRGPEDSVYEKQHHNVWPPQHVQNHSVLASDYSKLTMQASVVQHTMFRSLEDAECEILASNARAQHLMMSAKTELGLLKERLGRRDADIKSLRTLAKQSERQRAAWQEEIQQLKTKLRGVPQPRPQPIARPQIQGQNIIKDLKTLMSDPQKCRFLHRLLHPDHDAQIDQKVIDSRMRLAEQIFQAEVVS